MPVAEVLEAASNAALLSSVETLYAELDARIDARNPVCLNRGDCCKFGAFGHHLFVTPVELAYFVARVEGHDSMDDRAGSCPHQHEGRCTVRDARPMGCRVFFCEPASQGWQPDESEDTLTRIKALHQRFNLPYAYVEWLGALAEIDRVRRGS